jgi:hypothetical protein
MTNEKREVKVRINPSLAILIELKDEMSLAEFTAITETVNKLDRYSFAQSRVVNELTTKLHRKGRHIDKFTPEKKLELIHRQEELKVQSPEIKNKFARELGYKNFYTFSSSVYQFKQQMMKTESGLHV